MKYKGNMVYVRKIGLEIFEWLLVFNGEIFSGHMIISPRKGKTKLSKDEIAQSGALAFTGAVTTIDMLLKKEKNDQNKERRTKKRNKRVER